MFTFFQKKMVYPFFICSINIVFFEIKNITSKINFRDKQILINQTTCYFYQYFFRAFENEKVKIYRFVIIKYLSNETACYCYGWQEIISKHLKDFDLQSNKFLFELRKILIQHFLINETRKQFVIYFLNHKKGPYIPWIFL